MLGLIYFFYYTSGDTLTYHHAIKNILETFSGSISDYLAFLFDGPDVILKARFPILNEPRSAFFIRLISVLYLTTFSSYWLTSLYLSLLSFMGAWLLANSLIRYNPNLKLPAITGLLYMPTFVFWSSGILKESVAFLCIAMLGSYLLSYLTNRGIAIWKILLALIYLYILWKIKYYYAAVMILCFGPVLVYYTLKYHFSEKLYYRYIIIGSVAAVVTVLVFSHPNFHPARICSILYDNHELLLKRSVPGHAIDFIPAEEPALNFLINIPVSLFGGLFMPLIWQASNYLMVLTGIVNTVLLVCFLGKVARPVALDFRAWSPEEIALAFYMLFLAVLLAYSSPNFGTLERYKTSYIAFFTIWIFYENALLEKFKKYFKH